MAGDSGSYISLVKLPLWRLIAAAYADWFRFFPDVLRATLFWIILLAITIGLADWLKWSMAVSAIADLKARIPNDPFLRIVVAGSLYVFSAIVLFIASVDIAVSWHRRIICNERPALVSGNIATTFYWRYLANLIGAIVMATAPTIVPFVMFTIHFDLDTAREWDVLVSVTAVLMLLASLCIFVRLSPALVAKAIDGPHISWKQSYVLTRGATCRLAIGLFVCGIVPGIPVDLTRDQLGLVDNEASAMEALTLPNGTDLLIAAAIAHQILIVSTLLLLPIAVGFISQSYRCLAGAERNP